MEKITLKAARINAGLTQKQAAKALGIDETTLIRWEKNPEKIKVMYQTKIEEIYSFPIEHIFFGS